MDILIQMKTEEDIEKDEFDLNRGMRPSKRIKWKDNGLDELIKKKLDSNDFISK